MHARGCFRFALRSARLRLLRLAKCAQSFFLPMLLCVVGGPFRTLLLAGGLLGSNLVGMGGAPLLLLPRAGDLTLLALRRCLRI